MDPQCVLCEHNPHRRCNVNFAPKYLVNDVLKAKCEAPIRVEIIDRSTGVPVGEDIPDVHLEVCIVPLTLYCQRAHLRHRQVEQLAMYSVRVRVARMSISWADPRNPFCQAGFGRAVGVTGLVPCVMLVQLLRA